MTDPDHSLTIPEIDGYFNRFQFYRGISLNLPTIIMILFLFFAVFWGGCIGKPGGDSQEKPVIKNSDRDLIDDQTELEVYHTDPMKNDTDGDGVDDRQEIEHGSNPLTPFTFDRLDDFNRIYTYKDYTLDSQEKIDAFLKMVPNVVALDAKASEGFTMKYPVSHDNPKENLKNALNDPLVKYYGEKTQFILTKEDDVEKILLDGGLIYNIYDKNVPFVNPSYYLTHGMIGAAILSHLLHSLC